MYIYMCVRVRLCVCVVCVLCVCVGGRGGEEERRRSGQLIPSGVSLRITEAEQLYQVKRMIGGLGKMLFLTCSQTENV